MTIGEHYFVRLFGTVIGQQFLNTFAYRHISGPGSDVAEDLVDQVNNQIVAALAQCTGTYNDFDRLEGFSIETPTDYFDRVPLPLQGSRTILTAQMPPSYTAFGFRSSRAGAGSRSSYKRFCGLSEDDSDANDLTATFLALVVTSGLKQKLEEVLTGLAGNIFQPVQLKSGWTLGVPPIENYAIVQYGLPYLTSQVSRRK